MVSLSSSAKLKTIVFALGAIQILYFKGISAEGNISCGVPDSEPEKTCVSIRLPWQPEPIYFCIEKDKFKYRKQFQEGHDHYCGNEGHSENSLLIATPWDRCVLTSIPDHCVNAKCPPMPFNRTCTTVVVHEDSMGTPHSQCCGKYFCEKGTRDECNFKLLQPECNRPTNKTNCVAFVDPHGCCPKFQCDGDGKPGMCPKDSISRNQAGNVNDVGTVEQVGNESTSETASGNDTTTAAPPPTNITTKAVPATPRISPSLAEGREPYPSRYSYRSQNAYAYSSYSSSEPCVGDFNCPGTKKCCTNAHSGYDGYNGYTYSSQNSAVSGYCVEPVAE